jgi:hypothetical protein
MEDDVSEGQLPKHVAEAYRFYDRTIVEQDVGSVVILRREVGGEVVLIVRCRSSRRGWLELFDRTGKPLGYAITEWDCPVWTSKSIARRRALTGELDSEMTRQLAEAVRRLGAESHLGK